MKISSDKTHIILVPEKDMDIFLLGGIASHINHTLKINTDGSEKHTKINSLCISHKDFLLFLEKHTK